MGTKWGQKALSLSEHLLVTKLNRLVSATHYECQWGSFAQSAAHETFVAEVHDRIHRLKTCSSVLKLSLRSCQCYSGAWKDSIKAFKLGVFEGIRSCTNVSSSESCQSSCSRTEGRCRFDLTVSVVWPSRIRLNRAQQTI